MCEKTAGALVYSGFPIAGPVAAFDAFQCFLMDVTLIKYQPSTFIGLRAARYVKQPGRNIFLLPAGRRYGRS
jgi:hypothetical protein